jgi:hypothetical protein
VIPGTDPQYFITGFDACNFVGSTGSLDGDHMVITDSMHVAGPCTYDGLWFETGEAQLALSDDASTVTVTSSDTGRVAFILLDPARFPVAQAAGFVGTYQLTTKRLLVLDQDGTGRILDTVSQVATCPVTWTPPPALSITPADCPADAELASPFGSSLTATGEVRQRGSWLFVGSLAFTKITSAPAPTPVADLLANWPARPERTFTMADVPVLLPADRQGRYSLFDGYVAAPDSSTPVTVGDHFVQYLVNTTNPTDLLIVDTSLGRASLDRLGTPIVVQGWAGAWSDNGALTLLSESGRVVVTGSNARQQIDRLTRRASGAGWDLAGYSPMLEGWRYLPLSRFLAIDGDDYRATIRVTVGGADVYAYELNGPKLERIGVNGQPASSIENIGTWDVTWSPAPDTIVTVSYTLAGRDFDYVAFTALRPVAEAFAQSLQVATLEELELFLHPEGHSLAVTWYWSRSIRLRIFPLGFLGMSVANTTAFTNLKGASLPLHHSMTSASVSESSLRTTTASGDSPHFADGTPMTPTSATPGWDSTTFSISAGYTFSPPEISMSFTRSMMVTKPSASMVATSPVWSQPSTMVSSVASGRFQ